MHLLFHALMLTFFRERFLPRDQGARLRIGTEHLRAAYISNLDAVLRKLYFRVINITLTPTVRLPTA